MEAVDRQALPPGFHKEVAKLNLTKNVGVEEFVYVTSLPCDGKTHHIETRLAQLAATDPQCKLLHISANEEFTSLLLINNLANLKQQNVVKVVMHLNLSAFAPFDEVSRCFFNFLMCGYFWDVSSGIMDYSSFETKWHIFVEIPNVGVNVNNLLTEQQQVLQKDVDDVIDQLALVKCLGKHEDVRPDAPYVIDTEALLVCSFLYLRQSNGLDAPNLDLSKPIAIPTNISPLQLLERVFTSENCATIGKRKFHKKMWVKLLHQRVQWLQEVSANLKAKRAAQEDTFLGRIKNMYPL